MDHRRVLGLEAPPFGGREAQIREPEARKRAERLADRRQHAGEPRRKRAERRCPPPLGPQQVEGVPEHLAPLRGAPGRPVGADQRHPLVALEAMRFDRFDDGALRVGLERRERVGERQAERALVDAPLERWGELLREQQASRHPFGLLAEERGDRLRSRAGLASHGRDYARLVHRREGAARGVRAKQHVHSFGARAGPLDHGGDRSLAMRSRPAHPLEPVDELVGAVADRRDPDRHLGETARLSAPAAAAAELLEAGAHPVERQLDHATEVPDHAPAPSAGPPPGSDRTWWKPSTACGWKGR